MSWNGHYFGSGPSPLPPDVLKDFSNKFTQIGDFSVKLYELAHVHPVSKTTDIMLKNRKINDLILFL